MHPLISIIIPVFNVEEYLHQCLESILSQTFTDFECILVNDGSSDKSPEICDEYARKDKRIKVIYNEANMGSSLSRKTGLENSSGVYIQFVDSDDWIEKDMIEILYKKAISENYDMVICDCLYEKNGEKRMYKQNFSGFDKIAVIKDILSIRINTYLFNKLVKRDLCLLAEFPKHSRGEDYVITIQNVYNSKKIGYVNKPLYNYRYNAHSLSNNIKTNIITKVNGRIEENITWRMVISFLKEKYGDLKIFEPELSLRINWLKEIYMFDRDLKKIKELKALLELYPETKFYRWIITERIKIILKMILPSRLINVLKGTLPK